MVTGGRKMVRSIRRKTKKQNIMRTDTTQSMLNALQIQNAQHWVTRAQNQITNSSRTIKQDTENEKSKQ